MQETRFRLSSERELLSNIKHTILRDTRDLMKEEKNEMSRFVSSIQRDSQRFFVQHDDQLKNLEKIVQLMDPMNVVKRGYTITIVNGKLLRSTDGLKDGDVLNTLTSDGNIDSKVITIKKITEAEQLSRKLFSTSLLNKINKD